MYVFLISTLLVIGAVYSGRFLLSRWLNHLTMYSLIWWGMVNLYELKLMRYIDISALTWMAILGSFISFYLGVVFVSEYRKFQGKERTPVITGDMIIFKDEGKVLFYIILVTLILSAFFTIHHWMMLLGKFGSVGGVFLNANDIYRQRVDGKLTSSIPYVSAVSFVSIFFSGIYSAYKNKINLLSVLVLIVLILRQLADFSRAGILFGFFLFFVSFLLTRHFLAQKKRVDVKARLRMISIVLVLIIIIIGGAGLVRSTRGSIEHFQASSRELAGFTSGFFITPSLYLYLSSHIGVLNKYFEIDYYNNDAYVGESTFQPMYNFLSKFGFVEHIEFYDKGYFIPMWTNTGTWLRELYSDFGVAGIFIFPFLFSALISWIWHKFLETGSLAFLAILSYLFVLVLFSFLTFYTKAALWYISLILILLTIPLSHKLVHYHLDLLKWRGKT